MKLQYTTRTIGLLAGIAALGISPFAARADEGMKSVPVLQEKGVTTVTGNENWDAIMGFGKEGTMAEMMTLMMVGGSGMEHMKMGAMKPGMKMDDKSMPGMAAKSQGMPLTVTLKQNPPVVGENTLDIMVMDASGKPVTGLKLMSTVAMTSMDMGTAHPKVTEGKGGHYTVTPTFSMKGPWRVALMTDAKGDKTKAVQTALDFEVDGKTKWTPPKMAAGADAPTKAAGADVPAVGADASDWKITVNTDAKTLTAGKNALDVTILDSNGKPVTGAKVIGTVEMTSMDMGTTHPKAQEKKGGHYSIPVEFSMKGPWRVTLTVTPPKQKPFTKSFDFSIAQ